jgi:AraC-like DNA-binding protein
MGDESADDVLVPAGELIREVARRTPVQGPNRTEWPGLTCYRFDRPQPPQWEDVPSLTICFVVQGRKRVVVGDQEYFYDPFHYFVMTRGMHFQAEILEGTPAKPLLSLVLQADPAVVTRLYGDMHSRVADFGAAPLPEREPGFVSAIDCGLLGAVLRFVRSLDTEPDRCVLTPIYVQEIVYRVLRSEQCVRLADAAMQETASNPVVASIRYMREDLSRNLSVAELAEHVAMSQSAFAHAFKATTGVAPYQFVKRLRLERARSMLVEEGATVSDAAWAVGYSSLSHFINEFKRRYGVTPGLYVESVRGAVPLALAQNIGA